MKLTQKLGALLLGLLAAFSVNAQLIYGNTFPYWNVNGPLTVTGTTTLSGATNITGATAITGTTTNDAAAAGVVGEQLTTTVAAGSAIAGAATTAFKTITSVSLTAGDWDVQGSCDLVWTGVTATVVNCGLGTTTDVMASQAGGSGIGTDPATIEIATFGTTLSGTKVLHTPRVRVTLAATTTIYLVAGMTYSAGSFTQYGTIRARRVR